jgi:uncharacterized membrane protein
VGGAASDRQRRCRFAHLLWRLAVTALAGTVLIDAKRRRALGPGWQSFAAQTSIVPFAAIAVGRTRFNTGEIATWGWVATAITYAFWAATLTSSACPYFRRDGL